jgi:hypothetical protein
MLLQKQNKNKHGMKYYKGMSHEWNMVILKMKAFVYIKKEDSVKHRIA